MASSKTVLLTFSLCLLLTSCFRIENSMKVHDDGRLSVEQAIGINLETFSPRSIGMPEDSLPAGAQRQFCAGMEQGASDAFFETRPGQDVDGYKKGDYCGVKIKAEVPASTDHSAELSTMLEQDARLVQLEDGWEFDLAVVPERLAVNRGFKASDYREAREGSELTFELELPGSAIEGAHNATSVSGSKFTWEIDLMNPPERIFARTGPTTGLDRLPVSPAVIASILFAIAILGGVIMFFVRDKAVPVAATHAQPVSVMAGASTATTPMQATAAAGPTPFFDETMGVWVLDHPTRGRLWHRDKTDEWVPF